MSLNLFFNLMEGGFDFIDKKNFLLKESDLINDLTVADKIFCVVEDLVEYLKIKKIPKRDVYIHVVIDLDKSITPIKLIIPILGSLFNDFKSFNLRLFVWYKGKFFLDVDIVNIEETSIEFFDGLIINFYTDKEKKIFEELISRRFTVKKIMTYLH